MVLVSWTLADGTPYAAVVLADSRHMAEVLPFLALVLVAATLVVAVSEATASMVVVLVVVHPVGERPATSYGELLDMSVRLSSAAYQDGQLRGIHAAALFPISGDTPDRGRGVTLVIGVQVRYLSGNAGASNGVSKCTSRVEIGDTIPDGVESSSTVAGDTASVGAGDPVVCGAPSGLVEAIV
jgi:hypothetical protein